MEMKAREKLFTTPHQSIQSKLPKRYLVLLLPSPVCTLLSGINGVLSASVMSVLDDLITFGYS
jgi:hypothetical protein